MFHSTVVRNYKMGFTMQIFTENKVFLTILFTAVKSIKKGYS